MDYDLDMDYDLATTVPLIQFRYFKHYLLIGDWNEADGSSEAGHSNNS